MWLNALQFCVLWGGGMILGTLIPWVLFQLMRAKITVHVIPVDGVKDEHLDWCRKNCWKGTWHQPAPNNQRRNQLWFLRRSDAVMFKLTFADEIIHGWQSVDRHLVNSRYSFCR